MRKRNNGRVITTLYIKNICELISQGYTNTEITVKTVGSEKNNLYRAQYSLVSDIRCGRRYQLISSEFKFPKIGETVNSTSIVYYPRKTVRIVSDKDIEKICNILLTETNAKVTNKKIRDIINSYEKYGEGNISCDIYTLKRRILNGILYRDIYNKCAAKLGAPTLKQINSVCEKPKHNLQLTTDQVIKICELISDGYTNSYISDLIFKNDKHPLSKRCVISKIRNRRSYAEESKGYVFPKVGELCPRTGIVYYKRHGSRKKPEDAIREICIALMTVRGNKLIEQVKVICKKYNICISESSIQPFVSNIRHGRTYQKIYQEVLKDFR